MNRFFSTVAALALLPSLSVAQSVCGGMGNNGIWIGSGPETSDITAAADYMQMAALVIGQQPHTTLFSVAEPSFVRIEVEGQMGGDPVIDLMDDSGRVIRSDDDGGGGTASRIEDVLDAGTYCVATRSFDQNGLSALIRIGRDEHEPLTRGGGLGGGGGFADCSGALDLGVLSEPLRHVGSVDDTPALRFTLDAPMPIMLTAENRDADPTLDLLHMDGSNLASNDDFDGLNSRIDMTAPLPAGDYCIGVGAIGDTSRPITVSVIEYDPAAVLLIAVNNGEARPPLDGSFEILDMGTLSTSAQLDAAVTSDATWIKVAILEGGLLVVDAISVDGNGDPWLSVFDDFGRKLGMNDDVDGSYDAQVVLHVTPGDYYIAMKENTAGRNSFVRLGLRRWVPAQ